MSGLSLATPPLTAMLRGANRSPNERLRIFQTLLTGNKDVRVGGHCTRSAVSGNPLPSPLTAGLVLGLALLPPRPAAVDLDLEREAQERANRDDAGEHNQAANRRLDRNRVDDVRRNKEGVESG